MSWPAIKLSEVLTERLETPTPDDLALGRVRIISKISFNTGRIELRTGSKTNTGMILAHPGDLLVSGINAAKGAIAIYDANETAPVAATIHYVSYQINRDRADVRFLWWMLRSHFFQELLLEYVPGGIKTELKAKRLLPVPVPLPPLSEQRRIVARIEELAAQIEGAHLLRRQAAEESAMLVPSVHLQLAGSRKRRVAEILKLEEDEVAVQPTGSYPQVGVRSFGGGLFPKAPVGGAETTYRTFNRLYDGALVLSQVKGWEGAIAVCPPQLAGWFASPEYRTFRCIPSEASPHYLSTIVRTEWFWGKFADATRGVGARRERTRPEQFMALEVPMPDLEAQRHGEALFAWLDQLRRLQAETATELKALLPSILDRAFRGEP